MDWDSVLNVEENLFQAGYEEGYAEAKEQNLREGKQFGLQTGYQRFLVLGMVRGYVQELQRYCDAMDNAARTEQPAETPAAAQAAAKRRALRAQVEQLRVVVWEDVPMDNTDASVAQLERTLQRARNRLRRIGRMVFGSSNAAGSGTRSSSNKSSIDLLAAMDVVTAAVGGEMRVRAEEEW